MIRDALSESLALDGDRFDRFAALITAHTAADRLLTVLLTMRLARGVGLKGDSAIDRLLDVVAELGFTMRVDLAERLGMFTPAAVTGLRRLNAVRNRMLHAQRKNLDLSGIAEVQSPRAFATAAREAVKALIALGAERPKPSLRDLLEDRP